MKVFKFGGASVATADKIRNVAAILAQYTGHKLLVVVSAMGKTTNALEKVVNAFYQGRRQEALELFEAIKKQHDDISQQLGLNIPQLKDHYTEVEWLLHDRPVRAFDYYYDQVVCVGELLSTTIVSEYFLQAGIKNNWVDVRDIIRTDKNFRDARIDWEITAGKIKGVILPLLREQDIVLTQGFIGATEDNESTTLGREGSDYTAAVFANLLDAEDQTIWKDVQGVMNADPKQYPRAQWISELDYLEVIEMAYYGAQVIHPKTIKPLQNKGIPLLVRSFLNPAEQGTCIHNKPVRDLPPIIVYKEQQALLQLNANDFSFVGEGLTAEVYQVFEELKFKPNLTQNAAVSMLCVVDDRQDKVESLAARAAAHFDVIVTRGLSLLTVRHYNESILAELIGDQQVLLRQQTPTTVQVLMRGRS